MAAATNNTPLVGIVMGSKSDWEPTMSHAAKILDELGIPYEARVISAHRNPAQLHDWLQTVEARDVKVIIAGAGGAAHLPGVVAGLTHRPVIGIPCMGWALDGADSLYSIAQMPKGVPVACMSIGKPGAINGALFAASILAVADPAIRKAYDDFRTAQSETVVEL
jgi:5-(carboxyamino)imidazole ribonucleotide mutase